MGLGLLVPPALEQTRLFDGLGTASANSAAMFSPGTFFAVDTNNALSHYSVTSPGVRLGTVTITGLQPGENVLGIDFRPATGQLYALGSTSRIYVLNVVTGAAAPVDGTFTPALNGTDFGFDFNPTVDRIRVVSDAEQNIRLNPDTGAVAATDLPITPAGNVVGSAYTNNFAGATTTVLYGIDSGTDQLVIQNPPNDGTVTPVGTLGTDTNGNVGFDIAPGSGIAYASLTSGVVSSLYTINLSTGVATLVGAIPTPGAVAVRDIAVVAGPETVFGVTVSNNLVRFNSNTPGSIISTSPITGLQPGENILGIDFRPATGELYGLGSTSRIYRINTANGAATAVGGGPFTPALSGTDFGFDFNPTVDRIRIVSDAEQNLRAHPDLGTIVFTDTNLTPAGNVVAAAYTNNFAGASTTTLYDIDSNSDLLLIQNPPNNGVLNAVGPLNVNASGNTGFDIAPSGMAFASITLQGGSSTNYYTVNLGTGTTSLVGTIGGGEVIRDTAVRICTEVVYGITLVAGPANNLIRFNAATPGIIISTVGITGLQAGETIVGADFRPATGQLFAVGSTSRIYTINLSTGAATQVGPVLTTLLSGTNFGVDFNPTVDRIRIVSDAEQSIAVNPNNAAVTVNGALNPGDPNVVGAAYTNNFAGATSTTLYDVDSVASQLFTQNTTTGTLTLVGSLGIAVSNGNLGFDIASGSGNPYLSAYTGGANPGFYRVDLGTGTATLIANVNTTETLVDISIAISPTMSGADTPGVYLTGTASWFLRNSNSPGPADFTFTYGAGAPTMIPIKGDWDGDGDDTVGLYDTTTGFFFLRNSSSAGAADVPAFSFGPGGVSILPITGDWDGDGDDTVGIYDTITGNFFLRNTNTSGSADLTFTFGAGGAVPIAGDWNNDNTDTIGIYIAASGTFFLRNSNSSGPADIAPFSFGAPNSTPLAGDWNADGTDSVGIYISGSGTWFLSNGFTGTADFAFNYGPNGATGLAGDWDGQ
jgi:hypothetical protein